MTTEVNKIVVFKGKNIRKILHKDEWWFSVVDVVGALAETESVDGGSYWRKLKQRLKKDGSEVVTNCHGLKLVASDGKKYTTDCANTETMFRIIQSIPSAKAEPFKRWLAKVGYERVKEIEDPQLTMKRTRAMYLAKGYPEEWVERRIRGMATRAELTDEWENRGIEENKEYSILTAEITKATFGMTPSEYKEYKGLDKEHLRDHMDRMELLFTELGEATTTELAKKADAQGFKENRKVAKEGGSVAGRARKDFERQVGRKVSSKTNYLHLVGDKKNKALPPDKSK